MEVRGRERVGFNFKELIKSFVSSNDVNNDDIDRELDAILEQEDSKAIAKLEKETDPTRFIKAKKGGTRRKKGGLDNMKTEAVNARENTSEREAEEMER